MKSKINLIAVILIGTAMAAACNTLEVTMPKGPQGEQGVQGVSGKDGLSAYEIWVESIKDKTVSDWSGGTSVTDFFKYLKGKDGVDGKDGADGKNGKTAYELWIEYVASGVEDPKNPGSQWDRTRITEKDFYEFLSGNDGDNGSTPYIGTDGNWWIVVDGKPKDLGVPARGPKGDKGDEGVSGKDGSDGQSGDSPVIGENGNWWIGSVDTGVPAKGEKGDQGDSGADGHDGSEGLSAYELWVADVTSENGLPNPGNGVYDPDEYPTWPKDATSVEDFYRYLSGRDGKDGKDGESAEDDSQDKSYDERVDGTKYNVAPVLAVSRSSEGTVSYEYVNPFSGGAAFIVTGPGPVIIPGCEVVFTTMDGSRTYTKTSDASGYVYLSRSELPDWYDGAPSASDDPADISSGVKPLSFSFGGKTVDDAASIASTCKVPYKVGLKMDLIGGSLKAGRSLARYEVRRIVEGVLEEECFISSSPRGLVDDYRGCGYLHKVSSSYGYYRNEGTVRSIREMYSEAGEIISTAPPVSSSDEELLGFFSTISNLTDGEVPGCQRAVGKESFFSPAFGDGADPSEIKVDDPFVYVNKGTLTVRRYRPDYGLSISDPGRRIHVPYVAQLPDGILNSSYVWKSGHTTLTFELDWNGIGEMKVVDGYSGGWKDDTYGYSYGRFEDLPSRPGSVFSAFSAKGKFNGSVIDSKVTVSWRKPVVFTDIYDAFSVAIADVGDDFLLFKGLSGKFSYDASGDDEEGNGKAYMFGKEIPKSLETSD